MALSRFVRRLMLPVKATVWKKQKKNLQEAVELFFECASPQEIKDRLSSEAFVSSLEVNLA